MYQSKRVSWQVVAVVVAIGLVGVIGKRWYQREVARKAAIAHFEALSTNDPFPSYLSEFYPEHRYHEAPFSLPKIRRVNWPPWLERWAAKLGPKTKSLNLTGAKFTGSDLKYLQDIPGLTTLNLDLTDTTDTHLESLAAIVDIQHLSLWSTDVTDAGIVHLAALDRLESLRLSGTRVTDYGLQHYSKIPSLTVVDLSGTAVTREGILAFSESNKGIHFQKRESLWFIPQHIFELPWDKLELY